MFKLKETDRVVVLTGAGISKASGISTFRDEDGVWQKFDPDKVCTPQGVQANKELAWRFFQETYKDMQLKEPNPAHLALVKLEQYLKPNHFVLITQNIDGLHHKAGSKKVLEMHGDSKHMVCSSPRCQSVKFPIEDLIHEEEYQVCPNCGKMLRPSVVMFGEMPWYMDKIPFYLADCDLFLSIGTSGLVAPASSFAMRAWSNGSKVYNITYEEKGEDHEDQGYFFLNRKAEEFLPLFVDNLFL